MLIRKGTPEDLEELTSLYDDLNDYLEAHINYPGWKKGGLPHPGRCRRRHCGGKPFRRC